ncbi:MAG TPA: tRNA lysidine(34) synthetase TilS [Candidatus Saccharimonadales bacterium]|nr:tRNA lysidine(34) synthetase TilS [Candidatus Saccharimonadales bacterium]
MDIELESGKYVVAVSGGVDSVVLLALLAKQVQSPKSKVQGFRPSTFDLQLIVAHFDHGIREDSSQDRQFVQALARKYGLPFVYDEGRLGPDASEATARAARYQFLRKVQRASGARAIITAHHQDDLLETAILNLVRGTGRKGLSSLASNHDLRRPLLDISKQAIIDHAESHSLDWREDPTNTDLNYLRNHIRHRLMPRLQESDRQKLLEILVTAKRLNDELDQALTNHLHLQPKSGQLDRQWFVSLPHAVAREIMAAWLRAGGVPNFDRRTLERLVIGSKISLPGKQLDVLQGLSLQIGKEFLALKHTER